MECPACSEVVAEQSRFCSNCGHLLVRTEERRIVTVLFADLVGFTSLSEDLDPEQLKHLIDRCFQRLVADITAFGGTVDKIIGDAIVALFGAPKAHEDDPERAVRAALRMQRTLDNIAGEMGSPIRMRIGVNTGEVLVGALQAGGDYTAMGDTVNVASRLQHLAQPGEVLVGQSTRDATLETVEYQSRGDVALRGRDEAVHVYLAVTETAPPGRRTRRDRAPLVGRDVEHLQLVSGVVTSLTRGRAHLINILGEAGMGKTRLAEEVAAYAEAEHDAFILEGRVLPYGETNPLAAFGEAIAGACDLQASDGADTAFAKVSAMVSDVLPMQADSELERLTEVLLTVAGRPTPLTSFEPTRRAAEIRDGLRRFFAAATDRSPVVVVLGDIHWADDRLLGLVEYLLAGLASKPFIVIASARWTVDEERWVVSPGRHNTMVLNLDPLDRAASFELIAALIDADVPEELADQLHDRSGGNPFFLEEIASLLREAGLVGSALGTSLDIGDVSELPSTLRGLVAARLDALSAEERSMVENASVIGREGPVYALMLTSGPDEGGESTFRRLVDKDIFATEADGWTFRSDLVRDVAYSMLTKTERAAKHIDIADWLSANADDPAGRFVGTIANHYAQAAELLPDLGPVVDLPTSGWSITTSPQALVERAVDWLERAGLQADDRDSRYAAAQLFHRALGLVEPSDPRRVTAALGRAKARLHLRELAGATEDVEEAMALAAAAEPEDSRSIAVGQRLLGEIHSAQGDLTAAVVPLADALERFERLGDRAEIAETLRLRGMVSLFAGESDAADRDLEHARRIFSELGDSAGVGWCLQNLAWLSFQLGVVDEATERLQQALTLFAEVDDRAGVSFANGLMAFIHFHEARPEQAEALAEEVLRDSHERGERFGEAMMHLLQASIRLWSGQVRSAIATGLEAKTIFEQINNDYGRVQVLGLLGRAYAAVGDIDASRSALQQCLELSQLDPGNEQQDTFARLVNAGGAVQLGDPVAAREHLAFIRERNDERRVIGSIDLEVTGALALLQLGDVAGALDVLLRVEIADGSPRTYLDSSLALAWCAAGDTVAAHDHANAALGDDRCTYLDRRTAGLARALAFARSRDLAPMEEAFLAVIGQVDATESRMSQALVRLARAVTYEVIGDPHAESYRLEAETQLADVGIDPVGWERAFRLAAGEPVDDITTAGTAT